MKPCGPKMQEEVLSRQEESPSTGSRTRVNTRTIVVCQRNMILMVNGCGPLGSAPRIIGSEGHKTVQNSF